MLIIDGGRNVRQDSRRLAMEHPFGAHDRLDDEVPIDSFRTGERELSDCHHEQSDERMQQCSGGKGAQACLVQGLRVTQCKPDHVMASTAPPAADATSAAAPSTEIAARRAMNDSESPSATTNTVRAYVQADGRYVALAIAATKLKIAYTNRNAASVNANDQIPAIIHARIPARYPPRTTAATR